MFSSFAACCLASLTSRNLPWRNSAISRALRSSPSTMHFLARVRHVGQALDLDRDRRAGFVRPACRSRRVIARTRPNTAPASTMSPRFSVPDCTSTVATGPRPLSSRDFDDDALRRRILRRLELQHFGLQQDRVEQLVDALRRSSPTPARTATSPPYSSGSTLFGDELLLHAVGIGLGLVDLVHRDDDRHVGRLRVRDRFLGLRHHAVVGRDHQDDDVGRPCAPRARIAVNASWPGVSRKVIMPCAAFRRDRRRCAA